MNEDARTIIFFTHDCMMRLTSNTPQNSHNEGDNIPQHRTCINQSTSLVRGSLVNSRYTYVYIKIWSEKSARRGPQQCKIIGWFFHVHTQQSICEVVFPHIHTECSLLACLCQPHAPHLFVMPNVAFFTSRRFTPHNNLLSLLPKTKLISRKIDVWNQVSSS